MDDTKDGSRVPSLIPDCVMVLNLVPRGNGIWAMTKPLKMAPMDWKIAMLKTL